MQKGRATYCQLKSRQVLPQLCEKLHLKKLVLGEWPWSSLKVIDVTFIRQAVYDFLLVVYNNNDSIWHCFRDITTFTLYVTVW